MIEHDTIRKRAEAIKSTLILLRREFHQHPELGLQEFNTAKKIEKILKELGIETKMLVNGTGVVGCLKGEKPGKTLALRADIDALPVQEESTLPYRSQNPGIMHACGHDAHAAMLLGAAMILCEMRRELAGNVVFIFQPAEETGEGAKKMVEEGALFGVPGGADGGVDGIIGLHVNSSLDTGTLGYHVGPVMAAGDFFDIRITGKGGHGGMPHLAVDPIVIAANVISAIQTLVSRETDPIESAVVSICRMEAGGKAYNIIPDTATFGGTIRSLKPELRDYLPKRIKEILDGIVPAMRGRYEFNLMERFPVTINEGRMTAFGARVAEALLGKDRVLEVKPLMGSEDFSYYLQKVPGAYLFLGSRSVEKGITYPHHHPRFDIDEDVLPVGASLQAAFAAEYLGQDKP
jgi:amidohydrolase